MGSDPGWWQGWGSACLGCAPQRCRAPDGAETPQSSPGPSEGQLKRCCGALLLPGHTAPLPSQHRKAGVCGNTSRNQAEISLNTLFPCQPWLALPVSLGVRPCSCSELVFPPCPVLSLPTTASVTGCWAPMLEPGQEEAAGSEGGKSHLGMCKLSSMALCTCPDGTCPTWPCSAP